VPGSPEAKAQEIKVFTDRARMAIRSGNNEIGEKLLESLLAVDVPPVERKAALVEVAEVYASKGDAVKTSAIYERLCKELPNDSDYTGWLLRLGVVYRETGAYKLAISRFYGVIQMSMKAGSSNFEKYQGLTRQAQREIANTYFISGDFPQAQKFYNMALRTELPKEDRALATYRSAHCIFMQNDMAGAIQAFERFLKDFSRHPLGAEARYMLAAAYKAQNRPMDAYDTVLELLKDAKAKEGADPKKWAFWQKKAGNEFANDFYQRGDFVNAVTIYQSLAAIEDSPEWRWPVVYQMALCFERLRLEPRALDAYKYIVGESEKPENKLKKLPMSIENVVEMARFRAEHLGWTETVNTQLRTVAGPVVKVPRQQK
jgi:tetratricopeptide (TPR) repeat protein